jgi:hypothetical protein
VATVGLLGPNLAEWLGAKLDTWLDTMAAFWPVPSKPLAGGLPYMNTLIDRSKARLGTKQKTKKNIIAEAFLQTTCFEEKKNPHTHTHTQRQNPVFVHLIWVSGIFCFEKKLQVFALALL